MADVNLLYKLIVLYMLNKVDFPLATSQISDFILDKGYTTYFKLQQTLSELENSGFIRVENTHNRTLYHLTEEGEKTLHYFSKEISGDIIADIDVYLSEKKYDLKIESQIKADYYENVNHEYTVRLRVMEGNVPLIDLNVSVPSIAEAQTIADNWYKNSEEVYSLIMQKLL
ncbi:DNA-binding PadR family transcriptional regulator [Aequitasia blattaphilus]|uniref:DUF4364 family protein n=1 Tax=Aequitasia blattaphilus TaxID=2949332 RepID=A0ABT1EBR8_9FIRM|nr:DUF4364 family protein [Aequitasia blattaphilus]MCP1102291.1 DUF4364 family protein [Aequitasia blattaphilus]MCR8614931.1 DUF4364 family protein [Aequitasia blattaphilus]